MTDSDADFIVGALEDGFRPPLDPAEWGRIYTLVPGEGCPRCETAIGLVLGPTHLLEQHVAETMTDYVSVPDDWAAGYEWPVYLYCDNPRCSWQGSAEWADISQVLEDWIGRGAPTWRERKGDGVLCDDEP